MPRRPSPARRLATAVRWPVGIALTSWSYMWRTTPMHRREEVGAVEDDSPPPLPAGVDADEVQHPSDGAGPLFHRRYAITVREARLSPEELIGRVARDLNRVAPTEFAVFQKVHGPDEDMRVGDEYVVRMAAPWDGPVRVVRVTPHSFRFVTLAGHLEAGQIEFRAGQCPGGLRFEIESWARSGDRLSNLLYHRLRMAKEIQLHMWTSFLERVARESGGRLTGGIDIHTRRVEAGAGEA
ncbi:MAG TPA: DUF1990 family protein [Solirubrobacteraceae bacterium]|nr:DUF1990 family protein [Solirubrobacteraceae bacterium]